jgi:ABC-type nitrate/sulfonate/bicarbonate transport system substrate-binding protein
VQIGSSAERAAALENGAVYAAILAPPDSTVLEHQGFTTLREINVATTDDPSGQVVVAGWLVRDEPVLVQRLVNALIEATALAKREPELAKRVLRQYLRIEDEAAIDQAYEAFVQKGAPREPFPAVVAIRRAMQALAAGEGGVRVPETSAVVDSGFVQQAADTGFIYHVYARN